MTQETKPSRAAPRIPLWRVLALALVLALYAVAAGAPGALPGLGHSVSVAWASPAHDEPTTAAIRAVIEKANDAQQQAFAAKDPTPMKDTSTSSYYDDMVQTNQGLIDNGVAAIKLLKLEWGDVTLTSDTTATATTYETWQTTYRDGTTDVSRDLNQYTLVLESGVWKIQNDDHPGDNPAGAPGQTPATPTNPGPPSTRVNPNRQDISHNWSGYAATGGNYTSVTGTWTVTQSDGAVRFGTAATWVGIGGVTSHDLVQAGTMSTSRGNGSVQYQAWIETLPQAAKPISLAVKPGDSVTVSINETGTNRWQIAFKNNTTGATYETTVNYTSTHSSAEWVTEAPVAGWRIAPLDNFGTITFSDASAVKDSATVNIAEAGGKPITLVDFFNNTLATPSAITPDGSGFSVTRNATPTTTQPAPGIGGFPGQGVPGSGRSRGNGSGSNNGNGPGAQPRPPFGGGQNNPFGSGWPII